MDNIHIVAAILLVAKIVAVKDENKNQLLSDNNKSLLKAFHEVETLLRSPVRQ
jgi:hypothetical protein